MKRLIILENIERTVEQGVNQFKKDIKQNSLIKIEKEIYNRPQVIISFPDEKYQEIYEFLITLDVISVIDSILPKEEKL